MASARERKIHKVKRFASFFFRRTSRCVAGTLRSARSRWRRTTRRISTDWSKRSSSSTATTTTTLAAPAAVLRPVRARQRRVLRRRRLPRRAAATTKGRRKSKNNRLVVVVDILFKLLRLARVGQLLWSAEEEYQGSNPTGNFNYFSGVVFFQLG